MNEKNDILKNTDFWLELSERYFEADTTEEEEQALMRFVASGYADDASLDEHAKSVFQEVKATMSYMLVLGERSAQTQKQSESPTSKTAPALGKSNSRSIWRWVASAAAVALLLFIVKTVFLTDNDDSGLIANNVDNVQDVCIARENGTLITDKNKVLSMMHESWDEIDIHSSCGSEVGSQLKELFEVLE